MLYRRKFLATTSLTLAGAALFAGSPPAWAASSTEQATAFIKATGAKLVAAIDASGTTQERQKVVGGIIDATVDVNAVAKFCLGRFWRIATPDQQKQYLALFHDVLITNIASKLGEYRGVKFTVGAAQSRDMGEVVSTVVERPNNPPANIQWVIANAESDPKIVDVIAEGTSLRITQRDDYAAFLSRHSGSVDTLLSAMREQVTQNG
jgi:phospholipid transport system substrate-binding protein